MLAARLKSCAFHFPAIACWRGRSIMHKLIRSILCLGLVLSACTVLCAASLSDSGIGESLEDAQEQAMANLARQISVSVESVITTHSYDDGEEGHDSLYEQTSTQSTSFTFFGLRTSQPERLSDGSWRVTVTLPESSVDLYIDELGRLGDDIDSTLVRLGQLRNYMDISDEDYENLIDMLELHNAYRHVVMALDGTMLAATDDPAVSLSQVRQLKSAKDSEERNRIAEDLGYYKALDKYDFLTASQQRAMAEAEASLDESIALRQQIAREQIRRVGDSIALAQQTYGTSSRIDYAELYEELNVEDGMSVSDAVNRIESNKRALSTVRGMLTDYLEDVYDDMEAEASAYISSEVDATYPEIFIGADGRPLEEEVERRKANAQRYVDEEIVPSYIELCQDQMELYIEAMVDLAGEIIEDIEEMNEAEFTYNSHRGDELSVRIDRYDNTSHAFKGEVLMNIGVARLFIPLEITYEAWTGKDVPDPSSPEYDEYAYEVSSILDVLRDDSSTIMMEVDFHLEPYADSSSYGLVMTHWSITRLDNGERIINKKIKDGRMDDIEVAEEGSDGIIVGIDSEKASEMLTLAGGDETIARLMEKDGLGERIAAYSLGGYSGTYFSHGRQDGQRNLYNEMELNNLWGMTFGISFAGQWHDATLNADIGMVMPLNVGIFDEVHLNWVGQSFGLAFAAGAEASWITVGVKDEYKEKVQPLGFNMDLRARVGLGGTYTFGERYVSLMAYGTGAYTFGTGSINCGAELSLAYGSVSEGFGGGLGLTGRYDFYRVDDYDGSPWSFTIYLSTYMPS